MNRLSPVLRYCLLSFALVICNVIGARIGDMLAFIPANVSPIWPPAGFSLAAILLLGYRYWPGIWLGSFIYNLLFLSNQNLPLWPDAVLSCIGIATGSTLQALVTNYIARQILGFRPEKLDLNVLQKVILIGGPVCCTIGASVGTASLFLVNAIPPERLATTWVTWWFGDSAGVLFLSSLLISVYYQLSGRPRQKLTVTPPPENKLLWTMGLSILMAGILFGSVWTWLQIRESSNVQLSVTVLVYGLGLTVLLAAVLSHLTIFRILAYEHITHQHSETKRSQEEYQAILKQSEHFLAYLSTDERIQVLNPEAVAFWQEDSDQLIGKVFSETLWWIESSELYQRIHKATQDALTDRSSEFDASIRLHSGDVCEKRFRVKPVKDLNQTLIGILVEAETLIKVPDTVNTPETDVTTEILGKMNHAMRTSLSSILGFTEQLLETSVSQMQQKELEKIYACGQNLLSTFDEMYRALNGKAAETRDDFQMGESQAFILREVLEESLYELKQKAIQKNLYFQYTVDHHVPNYLIGDPLALAKILTHIVQNAVEFTTRGEIGVEVSLLKQSENNTTLQFSVFDSGCGMSGEQLDNLFTESEQSDNTVLKLQALARSMQGDLTADSQLGRGSVFRFTATFDKQVDEEKKLSNDDMKNMPILVVDDEPITLATLCNALQSNHLQPIPAKDADEALSYLQKMHEAGYPVPLVLSDIMLGDGKDGFEFVKDIRGSSALKDTKIILCTAFGDVENRRRCQSLGVNAYLTKPISPKDLIETVERVRMSEVHPANHAHILLVEDNDINQMVATNVLSKAGYSYKTAHNGQEAIMLCQQERFDLILMDVHMPVMDGFEATHFLRNSDNATLREIPILALTADNFIVDESRYIAEGMNGFINKPFQSHELLSRVEALLWGHASKSLITAADAKLSINPLNETFELDRESVLDRVGGNPQLLERIITMFCESYPEHLRNIDAAIQNSDADLLQKRAHAFKGSIANFTTQSPYVAAFRLERMGRENDLGRAKAAYLHLKAEIKNLESALKETLEWATV